MANNDFPPEVKNLQGDPSEGGLTCFEVVGLAQDRDLICRLAQHLSVTGADATSLRLVLNQAILDDFKKGGILASLRNSPLVDADGEIDLTRPVVSVRTVELYIFSDKAVGLPWSFTDLAIFVWHPNPKKKRPRRGADGRCKRPGSIASDQAW